MFVPVLDFKNLLSIKTVHLKEIFGAGTAAVVLIDYGFSYQDVYYELPKSKILCGTIKIN
jgi:branched-chain amino acid aminotransferase